MLFLPGGLSMRRMLFTGLVSSEYCHGVEVSMVMRLMQLTWSDGR